jgi:hypothetical protein
MSNETKGSNVIVLRNMGESFKPERAPGSELKEEVIRAGEQFKQFQAITAMNRIEVVREFIMDAELQTLEEYTGVTAEALDAEMPGVREKYNALVRTLQDPNLTIERFKNIVLLEASDVVHGR